jgi:hypothetical protein
MNIKVKKLQRIVAYRKMNNFFEGFIDTQEDMNLKTVIDIQKIELKLVAFSLVATFCKTAYEEIHPP